jgi:hypothetical protein
MRPRWISATRSQRDASSMYGVEATIVSRRRAALQQVPELAPRHGVDARRRLVEQQELGRCTSAQQSASFCFIPPRARPRAGRERRDLLVDRRDELAALLQRGAEHRREEAQVLLHAEIGVQRESPGHVADRERIAQSPSRRPGRARVASPRPGAATW